MKFIVLNVLVLGNLLLVAQCNAQPKKLRDPFSCSHFHGTVASHTASVSAQTPSASQHAPIASSLVDASSEWQVVAEKDDVVIMQHRDGSIREITLGKK